MIIRHFRDLDVYKAGFKFQQQIFEATKIWPREETYALTGQIRRSSRSIGANLAESWAKRRYPAHFLSKLTDADGELQETEHWLDSALACGYLPEATHEQFLLEAQSIGRMLGSMISKHESFQIGER